MMEEHTIWQGTPSQWSNFLFFLMCSLLIPFFGLGLVLALFKYWDTRSNMFMVTDQRIIEQRGMLSKVTKEMELYRVKDIQLREPWHLRMFGLSNIVLLTTDQDTPKLTLRGLDQGASIKERVRSAIDLRRDLKRVREIDLG